MSPRIVRREIFAARTGLSTRVTRCVIVAVLFALGAISVSNLRLISFAKEDTTVSDEFGYTRQAELFREKGIVGGLFTALTDPASLNLVDAARKNGGLPDGWAGIWPTAHNYAAPSGKLILQYSPGTGFGMAIFPFGYQGRYVFMAYSIAVFAVVAMVIVAAGDAFVAIAVGALGIFCLMAMYRNNVEYSIHPSVFLTLILGVLTPPLLMPAGGRQRGAAAVAWGLIFGILVSVRLANILLIFGPGLVMGFMMLRNATWSAARAFMCLGAGAAVGLVPFLAANAINAGHIYTTTYGGGDAVAPRLSLETIAGGLRFFFVENPTNGFFVAVAAIMTFGFLSWSSWREPRFARTAGAIALSFVATVAFLLTHEPRAKYYLLPAAAYAASAVIFSLRYVRSTQSGSGNEAVFGVLQRRLGVCAVSLGLIAFAACLPMRKATELSDTSNLGPAGPDAVIWADTTAKPLVLLHGRQAGELLRVGPELRDAIVGGVSRAGTKQYLILDSAAMTEEADRLSKAFAVEPSGDVFGRRAVFIAPVAHTVPRLP